MPTWCNPGDPPSCNQSLTLTEFLAKLPVLVAAWELGRDPKKSLPSCVLPGSFSSSSIEAVKRSSCLETFIFDLKSVPSSDCLPCPESLCSVTTSSPAKVCVETNAIEDPPSPLSVFTFGASVPEVPREFS